FGARAKGLEHGSASLDWAGTTPRFFLGASKPKKGGRSSPGRCFARAQTLPRAERNHNALRHFRGPLGERNGERRGETRLSWGVPRRFHALRDRNGGPRRKPCRNRPCVEASVGRTRGAGLVP